MNILVTGATGFIGSNLTKELITRGYKVHILSRDPGKSSMFDPQSSVFFNGDITDKQSLVEAMKGCEGVFHLAAYAKVWSKDKNMYNTQNVLGTQNVFEAAKVASIKKILVVSTAGVFGPSGDHPVDETTIRKKPYFTQYEKTKSLADKVSGEYVNKGISVITVFPTRVFGPGPLNESNSATKLIHQYSVGKWRILPGNGNKIGNYVYIDNLISGMINAFEKGRSGEGYLLGGSDISYLDFFKTISDITGKKYFMIRIPLFLALAISSVFSFFARITGIPPLITPGWIKKYLHDWSVSSAKAMYELGYNPGSFREEVAKTLEWFDSNQSPKWKNSIR